MAEQTALVRHSQPEGNDSPGYRSMSVERQRPAVQVCRDVYQGTLHLRTQGNRYLPQFPKEQNEPFAERVQRAVLYNAFRRTVKGLTGMVFRKDPQPMEDVPPDILPHLENIDLAGRHLTVFLKDLLDDKLQAGHGHIVVDWHGPDAAPNRAAEDGARPYWVHVKKDQVLRQPFSTVEGETVLDAFAYEESDVVPEGEFGEREIQRVRQYELLEDAADPRGSRVQYRSWTRNADSEGEWAPEETGRPLGPRMPRLPVVTDYAGRTAFMESDPPLLDLALWNVRHYQVDSDRAQSLSVANKPIFVTTGVNKDDISVFVVGAALGLALPPEGKAEYVETLGRALGESRSELQDIEQRMAALGLSMLVRQTRSAETAEAKRIDKSEQDSELAASARGTKDAAEEALMLHAMWMGLPTGGSLDVNMDFSIEALDPQMLAVLAKMAADFQLPLETLWDIMSRHGTLPDSFDPEVALAALAEQGEAELQAAVEAMREAEGARGSGTEAEDEEMGDMEQDELDPAA